MKSSLIVYKEQGPATRISGFGFFARDMPFPIDSMDVAEITLTNRYPEMGYTSTTVSDMIARVLEGGAILQVKSEEAITLSAGAVVAIPKNAIYCWQPLTSVKLFLVRSPPPAKDQQKLFDQ